MDQRVSNTDRLRPRNPGICAVDAPPGAHDISPLLRYASSQTWSLERSLEVAARLAAAADARVDHDAGAGEMWARIVRDRGEIGFVHCKYRFVLASYDLQLAARDSDPVVILSVDLSETCLSAGTDALDQFCDGASNSPVLQDVFSALDLWYATV